MKLIHKSLLVAVSCALTGAVAIAAGDGSSMQEQVWRAQSAARIQAPNETFGTLQITNARGAVISFIAPDPTTLHGVFAFGDANGNPRGAGVVTPTGAGRFGVFNGGGVVTHVLDGDSGYMSAAGDVAERFPSLEGADPGSVMVIDAARPGALRLATSAYDHKVAGIVAGANEYRSAITLRSLPETADRVPVTLTGTVYCKVSAINGPVRAGDLLTTSSVPGYAMKVTDPAKASGAILGKAMEDLKGDQGMVLVLASLQ